MNPQFGGPWTVLKLEIVRQYLVAYVQALKNQSFCTHYIDAFAGTGYVELRGGADQIQGLLAEVEEVETASQNALQGSARQALEIDPPFDQFTFIERSPWRSEQLARLQASHFDRWGTVNVLQEDANIALQRICARWNRTGDRAVVFLDPFGMSVDWVTLQAIARTQSMDMWYLFPLMAVNRLLPRERPPLPEWEDKLNRFFGTANWRDEFYRQRSAPTLFDEVPDETITRIGDMDRIRDFVLARFRAIFPAVADNPRFLCTQTGTPLFLLCFAASNPRGAPIAIRIAQHILGTR
jgi:three-Cys-motif partner protein